MTGQCLGQASFRPFKNIQTSAPKRNVIRLGKSLKRVNEDIWDLEDQIRDYERDNDFGAGFIDVARKIYRTDDQRAALKRDINLHLGSTIVEEKSYADY